MREDEHPWIETDPQGMLVVMLLRRMGYSLLTPYRYVTLRSEEHRPPRGATSCATCTTRS